MHEFHEKPIAFIQAKGDTFQAKIGVCYDSDGDNDCFVSVTHTQNPTKDLADAQKQIEEVSGSMFKVFPKSIPVDSMGMVWLSVIQSANKD
jgi:hypothetical protein